MLATLPSSLVGRQWRPPPHVLHGVGAIRGAIEVGSVPDVPPYLLSRFDGSPDTLQKMREHIWGDRGERSEIVRQLTEEVVSDIWPKDYLSEILAIRYFCTGRLSFKSRRMAGLRYLNDPLHVERIRDPENIATELRKRGVVNVDCFPAGTLVLKKGHELVAIESLRVGDEIWGQDRWSRVEGTLFKGTLAVDSVRLSNGSTLLLTGDHHVYVRECENHPRLGLAEPPEEEERFCSCGDDKWHEVRIRVADLRVGMVLTTPDRIPFGSAEPDPRRAYVEGLYVSDGWSQSNYVFAISGQDGCPKEQQKREVERICSELGIRTTWQHKSVHVIDQEWAVRVQLMGKHAPQKHLLSIDLGEAAAAATLRGVMADSGANTGGVGRTFTTTSRELALQVRVLHKMFGIPCGRSYIEHHGGLGTHPIYRLGTRGTGKRAPWKLRVREIQREMSELPCWDIQTDDHRVYLAEHDVTVSQCDEIAELVVTMVLQVGRDADLVVVGFEEPGDYSHVFGRAREPKTGQAIVCDPVAGQDERGMLERVTTYEVWPLDRTEAPTERYP